MIGRPVLCYKCQGAGGTFVKDEQGYRHQNSHICEDIQRFTKKRVSPLVTATRLGLILPEADFRF